MDREAELYENLVLAVLSVNSFPLEKVYRLREDLRKQGLFSPKVVVEWDHPTSISHLVSAGYDRGDTMNSIFASRLQELAMAANSGTLDPIWKNVLGGSRKNADEQMLRLHGVGPAVLRNFWTLQEEPIKK